MIDTDVSDVPRLVRLLLVDDHEMVLDAMRAALEAHEHMEVSAVASSEQAATEKLTAVEVDLVVTDLMLGDGAGTDLVDVAQSVDPPPPVF